MKSKNTTKSLLNSSRRHLLPITRFILDRKGKIREIDKNIEQQVGWTHHEMIGKSIADFLLPGPWKPIKKQLRKFTECQPKFHKTMYCRIKRPKGKGHRNFVTYLIGDPEDNNLIHGAFAGAFLDVDPRYKKSHMIAASSHESHVFLQKGGRILDFDYGFLADAAIGNNDLDRLSGKPLASLIDPRFITADWLSHRPAVQYMTCYAREAVGSWTPVYLLSGKSSQHIKEKFIFAGPLLANYENGVLSMHSKHETVDNHYAILNIPVNLPTVDLRVEYECRSPNPMDLSAILGGNNYGGSSTPDDCGYFFGYGCSGQTNNLQRKTVTIHENKTFLPKPNQWYHCCLERIGGRFLLKVDRKNIFKYFDPEPIFGAVSRYFSFYFFGISAQIKNLSVFTRKSTFDYQKLHRINQRHIVFKNNPDRMYQMRWTARYKENESPQLVFFNDISEHMDISTEKRLHGTVSTRARLEQARTYIADNFHRQISFKELSKKYHMARGYFFAIFKNSFGVSPKDYQVNLRIDRAKQMLVSGRHRNKEVALLNGYKTENGFMKAFIKREGVTPGAFIRKNKI